MSAVQTVGGEKALADLGTTLMREHVFVMAPEALSNFGAVWGWPYWDEEERVADAIAKLQRLRDGGITILVDPMVLGLGRDIPRIQRINAQVDLNIVVASGLYAFLEMPGFLAPRTDEVIAELFVRELTQGINDTGVRAAFLKCAVESHGLIGDVPRRWSPIRSSPTRSPITSSSATRCYPRCGRQASRRRRSSR